MKNKPLKILLKYTDKYSKASEINSQMGYSDDFVPSKLNIIDVMRHYANSWFFQPKLFNYFYNGGNCLLSDDTTVLLEGIPTPKRFRRRNEGEDTQIWIGLTDNRKTIRPKTSYQTQEGLSND